MPAEVGETPNVHRNTQEVAMTITIGIIPQEVDATEMAAYIKNLLEAHSKGYEPVDLIGSHRLPPGNNFANPNTVYFFVIHSGHDFDPEAQAAVGRSMTDAFTDWRVLVVWIQAGPFFANGAMLE